MQRAFATLAATSTLLGALISASPARAEWRLPPAGYAFTQMAGCETTRPPGQVYDACADQMRLLAEARAEAIAAKRQLMVVLGANWCPSCRGLHRDLTTRPVSDRVHVVHIAVSEVQGGRMRPVPSGEALQRALLADHPDVKPRGIPFLVVIDPQTGRSSVRNLGDLESSAGWNTPQLAQAIDAAESESRGGPKAPVEPGWLLRKWRRLVGG